MPITLLHTELVACYVLRYSENNKNNMDSPFSHRFAGKTEAHKYLRKDYLAFLTYTHTRKRFSSLRSIFPGNIFLSFAVVNDDQKINGPNTGSRSTQHNVTQIAKPKDVAKKKKINARI